MDNEKLEFRPVDPITSTAPRYPNWEIKETGFGFERRTIMTEEEFKLWRSTILGNRTVERLQRKCKVNAKQNTSNYDP